MLAKCACFYNTNEKITQNMRASQSFGFSYFLMTETACVSCLPRVVTQKLKCQSGTCDVSIVSTVPGKSSIYFSKISRTWKVLKNEIGPGN